MIYLANDSHCMLLESKHVNVGGRLTRASYLMNFVLNIMKGSFWKTSNKYLLQMQAKEIPLVWVGFLGASMR